MTSAGSSLKDANLVVTSHAEVATSLSISGYHQQPWPPPALGFSIMRTEVTPSANSRLSPNLTALVPPGHQPGCVEIQIPSVANGPNSVTVLCLSPFTVLQRGCAPTCMPFSFENLPRILFNYPSNLLFRLPWCFSPIIHGSEIVRKSHAVLSIRQLLQLNSKYETLLLILNQSTVY